MSPVKIYKNISKMGRNNEFTDCVEPFLSLHERFDVFVVDNEVYFCSQKGEELFNMESTFTNVCNQHIQEIDKCKIVNNIDALKYFSSKTRYTKYYINFNAERLKYISDKANLKKIAQKFKIKTSDGKIDTNDDVATKNFIRFICNKGMIDPCDMSAVEVSNAKKW